LLVVSWLGPVVLELTGAIGGTFELAAHQLHLTSNVYALEGNHTMAILIGANVVTIIVIGLFANALATSRRDALRKTEIQAWHLKQLLPHR
jgi:hypothetical protein